MSCVLYICKKKMKHKLITLIILVGLLNACKKEEQEPLQNPPPNIAINDPKKENYNLEDTVFINVIVTDEQEMCNAEWFLILNPQNDTLWTQKKHSHATEIIFNTYYPLILLSETFLDQQNVDFIVKAENAFGEKTTEMHNFIILNP